MLLNVPLFRPSPPVSLLLTSSCFYILWHLAQRLYVCSIVLCSTLNLPSLSLVSNRVAWSSPPSGFLWQVLLGADTVLACSPAHQSPACGIGEQRKAPPWEMPVKTLFHPVLLSLSLLFLVSYEHLTLRSLVALSFLTVLIRSMPQEGIYPIFTLIWNSSPISFHFTVRSSSTLCVTHNPLFGLTPFSSHHVWLQIPRGHLVVLEITFLFMVLDNPPPSLRDRHPPPPPSSPLPECG